ncbi:MAG: hypothetical protein FJ271_05525 [Planctomycetes bacterium]|nr:hypothetical protein [Planctomycetota bacterium]
MEHPCQPQQYPKPRFRAISTRDRLRWTHKKTGACKCFPAITVAAAEGKTPGTHVLKITFKANALAEFFLGGDGDSDLDVIVKDSNGKIVARDVDPGADKGGGSDLCVCRWTPTEEQEYTIIIINHGAIVNIAQAGCN